MYDLELLSLHPGRLEQLHRAVCDVLDHDTTRTRWLRDLVVYEGYHLRLRAAVERALRGDFGLKPGEANDADVSLRGYLRWCAAQPESPGASFRALTGVESALEAQLSKITSVRK